MTGFNANTPISNPQNAPSTLDSAASGVQQTGTEDHLRQLQDDLSVEQVGQPSVSPQHDMLINSSSGGSTFMIAGLVVVAIVIFAGLKLIGLMQRDDYMDEEVEKTVPSAAETKPKKATKKKATKKKSAPNQRRKKTQKIKD